MSDTERRRVIPAGDTPGSSFRIAIPPGEDPEKVIARAVKLRAQEQFGMSAAEVDAAWRGIEWKTEQAGLPMTKDLPPISNAVAIGMAIAFLGARWLGGPIWAQAAAGWLTGYVLMRGRKKRQAKGVIGA